MSTTRRSGSSRRSASHSVWARGAGAGRATPPRVRCGEVLGEPLRLGKGVEVSHRCYLFLLKEVVFASESFGEFPGPFGLVLAEPAFDDLVLQVVFYTLDPTPRSTPKEPHEIVAVDWAL